ncbi:MAG TPA: hypothetical protein VK738_16110 [Terriglobales bacterium]|jgi:hypothetical protein|nr:hypothetical protein [Terriglobales bacterium]
MSLEKNMNFFETGPHLPFQDINETGPIFGEHIRDGKNQEDMAEHKFTHSASTLLAILEAELEFLEKGGYHQLAPKWYASLIFEEGPHCAQLAEYEDCQKCPLIQFVPLEDRLKPSPCRYIVLTANGQTLESLYRTATQKEIQEVVRKWLIGQIHDLRRSLEEVGTDSFEVQSSHIMESTAREVRV